MKLIEYGQDEQTVMITMNNAQDRYTKELESFLSQANYLAEDLENGSLHKIFLLCPDAHQYIQVLKSGKISFVPEFTRYLNKALDEQPIYFSDDNPRQYHRFTQPGNVMLTLLIPPHMIVCVDGKLGLKKDKLIIESIVGGYLYNDSDQFYQHASFDPKKVKQWIN